MGVCVFLGFSTMAAVLWADTITHFQSVLNSDGVVRQGVMGTISQATGVGTFTLTQPDNNPSGTTLSYFVQFQGVDLDGTRTPGFFLDDVIGIHFHDVRECLDPVQNPCLPGDTAGTHHLLNVYGFPARHDNDLVVNAAASTIQGLWDDGDANMTGNFHSHPVSDHESLEALFGGFAFLMIHTNEVPDGAFGGYLVIVPEPTTAFPGLLLGLLAICRRGR
jgi:hypothetical protein